jgi:mannosyltransferase
MTSTGAPDAAAPLVEPHTVSDTPTRHQHRRISSPARRVAVDMAAVIAPSALGAGLTFYDIGARSIWLDEGASIAIASQHGAALGAAMAHDGGNMLVYYALLHVLIGAFGNGALVIRAPSAIATACTVALVSILARRLFDRRVALASGVLTAVSLPLVFWGQDARAYAMMTALVAASFLAFVALVDRDPPARPSRWAWIAYVVVTTLAMYMSFVAVLVVPAQLLSLVCHRRRLRPVLSALAVSALCCAPLAVLAHQRGAGQLFWVPKPSLSAVNVTVEELTSSALQPQFALTATSHLVFWLTLVLLMGAAAVGVRTMALRYEERAAFSQLLLVSWLVVPVLLALAESAVGQSIFVPRNLLISLPPVGILIASLALGALSGDTEPHRNPARWSRPGWLAVGALVALRAVQLAPSYGVSPENWKSAVSYVLARAEPRDCIAFYPSDGRMAFEYYVGSSAHGTRTAPRPVLPTAPWGEVTPYVEDYATLTRAQTSQLVPECRRLWFVTSHEGVPNGSAGSAAHYSRYRLLRSALEARFAHHATTAFGYADPVDVELLSP